MNTCKWLLTKCEYIEWLDGSKLSEHHGLLWIKGNPGCGKSTIMKFAFADMAENSRKGDASATTIVLSFFFNARGKELEQTALGMCRSLVFQLLDKLPHLQDVFGSVCLTAPDEVEFPVWEIETVKFLFRKCVEQLGLCSLICFIDALDECDEDQVRDIIAYFEELRYLAVTSQVKFRVCFSSRHYPAVIIERGIQLVLDIQKGHHQDIADYVHSVLKCGQQNADQIKSEIIQKSSGTFYGSSSWFKC